jgi:RND family efflux transporter MFP subunit
MLRVPREVVAVSPLRRTSAYLIAAAVAIAAVVGFGTAFVHHAKPVTRASAPSPAITVTVARPRQAVWARTLEASGAIAAWQEASVGSQIGGYSIVDVRVNVGDTVRKGQILARLNRSLLEANAAQLTANRDQAVANRERTLALKSSGAVSDQDVLQYVTQAKTAEAQLETNRLQLLYTDVLSPDDGVISSRTATLGAVVTVGQELFRLIRGSRLEWRGELTAPQLSQIAAGQIISLRLPDGTQAKAKVRETAPSLDPQTRLGIVYADITPGTSARSGMYADGFVDLGPMTTLVIPSQSVIIRDGRSYVVKLSEGGDTPRVSLQRVEAGARQGDEIEALSGVKADDTLVAQGAGFLNDGDVVRIQGGASKSAGSGS